MIQKFSCILVAAIASISAMAQSMNVAPDKTIEWDVATETVDDSTARIVFSGKIVDGWHTYDTDSEMYPTSVEFSELSPQQDSGQCSGGRIGQRHTHPHSVGSEELGEYQQEWNQENQLSGEGEEDGFGRHADGLEEVGGDHLEPDKREHGQYDTESVA